MDRGARTHIQDVPPCPRPGYEWAGQMCPDGLEGGGVLAKGRLQFTRMTRQGCNTGYGSQARSGGLERKCGW